MITKYKIYRLKNLYIFFAFLSLTIFFFSTARVEAKAFEINNIEISKPFEMSFNKNKVIDDGFRKAFKELISLIVNSSDRIKVKKVKLNEIKAMIESFSIKEEKFINEVYFVNLGVAFNKRKILNYLEEKNIFPSIPLKKKLLFMPIIIDENQKELLIFSNNKFYEEWNNYNQNYHLLEYILPTEDLEDLNFIKSKFDLIEQYDFKEITDKYNLKDSIIALIFKNEQEIRILSRITIKENVIIRNQSFLNTDLNNIDKFGKLINNLKTNYEDYWKNINQINTSIKLPLTIKVASLNNSKIIYFEKTLNETDLIYNFHISKFDKDFTYYQVIYNGTPNNFLNSMSINDLNFDTQNKIWVLK